MTKLVIGLGNPGAEFAGTRHNVGFFVLDQFAKKHGLEFAKKDKFKGYISEFDTDADKIFLLKPDTFYNLSGDSAIAVANFYKITPQEILVIHDELALPFGVVRTRLSGSDAGNNGIKSLTATLGQNYARIRVGIKNQQHTQIADTDFVLGKFTKLELDQLKNNLGPKVTELVNLFISGNLPPETHKV